MPGNELNDAASAAVDFVNALAGETLIGADTILDEIRRAFWWVSFSGDPLEHVCNELALSAKARALLPSLEGKTVAELDFFIGQVRTFLWMQTFSLMPESRFARETNVRPVPAPANGRLH